MREVTTSPAGRPRIHALPGFVLGHLAQVLQQFQTRQPQIVLGMIVNDAAIDPVKEDFNCARQIYVLEALRAEGNSPWFTCAHDEFAPYMDGEVEVHLVKLGAEQRVPDVEHNGAVLVKGEPKGQKMAWLKLRSGHQALLPKNAAWRRWRSATTRWRPNRKATTCAA